MWSCALVFLLALGVRLGALVAMPADTAPSSDGAQYVNLGASVADGHGFVLSEGNCWPRKPTIIRAPGWPLILAGIFQVVPDTARWPAARVSAAAIDSINAVLIMILALRLGARLLTATMAGLIFAMNVVSAGMCSYPASEPAGLLLILLSLIVLVRSPRPATGRLLAAGLLLGLACLVRPNWLLIALLIALGFLWLESDQLTKAILRVAGFLLVVALPLLPWVIRNAMVFQEFPLLGAGKGETLYGGNNDLAAEVGGKYWGYLVLPSNLPGEKPLPELAATMSEPELDRYYTGQARQWIRDNPRKLPMLVVGKLRRAYVPWPRVKTPSTLIGSTYRGGLFLLALIGAWLYFSRRLGLIPRPAMVALVAVVAAHIITVMAFCGLLRFVLASDALLSLPAAYGLVAALRTARGKWAKPRVLES